MFAIGNKVVQNRFILFNLPSNLLLRSCLKSVRTYVCVMSY